MNERKIFEITFEVKIELVFEWSLNLLKFDIFTSGSSHYILEMGYPKDVRQTERIYQKGLTTKKFPKEEAFPKA